eukprot:gene11382-12405_t
MNPFASLSDENQDQIRKYLKFFRQKKDGILRSIQREINDLESERLNEEVFTREDVLDLVEFFSSAVKSQIAGDVGSIVNMGALALSQLLDSSQDKGVELLLETHALENQALLEAVEAMSLEPVPRAAKRGPGTLTSFKDEAKAIRDEQHRIEETNKRLQAEVTMLRDRLKLVDKQYSSLSESKQRDEMSSRDLERALEEAKEENAKRISDTTQFQQMRKLMQSQSVKIRDLRKRLQKYEPDSVKEDDDF